MPSGFWNAFQTDFLKENVSDQGPYGGHRAILWHAPDSLRFRTLEVLGFAKSNGWNLVDSLRVDSSAIRSWQWLGNPVFPLSSDGFSLVAEYDYIYKYFPRWIFSNAVVYIFKTGWLTYQPGSDNSTDINGFILLSEDGKILSVYHLWGE